MKGTGISFYTHRNNSIKPPFQISPPLECEFLNKPPLLNKPPPSNILPDSVKKDNPLIKSS